MLATLKEVLSYAQKGKTAIGSFNTPNSEGIWAVLDAAEKLNVPVIIAHAQCHEYAAPLDKIAPLMVAAAKSAKVPVCVHLDHCEHLSYMRRALEVGFSGAMYDGSMEPYEVNVENSARAAAMVHDFDCGLECELGSMGSREGGASNEGGTAEEAGAIYTDPDQAREFVESTGLDVLACSFGTVHGLYKGEPHLSFDVLTQIRDRVKVPLVMHGGSGVSDEDYHKAIDAGIRKINYFTYGDKFAAEAACSVVDAERAAGNVVYWTKLTSAAYERLVEDFVHVIEVFANGAEPVA